MGGGQTEGIRGGFLKDVAFEQDLRYLEIRNVAITGKAF